MHQVIIGVGSINSKIKGLPNQLASLIQAEGLTDEANAISKRGWTIPINLNMANLHSGRTLLIGDAAGLANGSNQRATGLNRPE